MELLNLTLSYLIEELRPCLENAFVNKIQEVSNNVLKLKIRGLQGAKTMIVSLNAFFLTNYSFKAKMQTSGFGAFLRKRLEGKKILRVFQHKADRVIVLEFNDFFLVLELFANGNIVLTDKNFKILSAFRFEEWKDRQIKKGVFYRFPESNKLNPFELNKENFFNAIKSQKKDVVRALISSVNIAPQVAEEICFQLKISKEMSVSSLNEKLLEKLFEKIVEFYSIDLKKLKPVIVILEKNKMVLPFKFYSISALQESVGSINEAIDNIFSENFFRTEERKGIEVVSKKIAALEHSLKEQLKARERFKAMVEKNKRKAELIYKHYPELQAIMEIISSLQREGKNKEEIMYKLSFASKKGVFSNKIIKSFKKNRLIVELD
jgi:predicted ribosome quality control (RQC) complex YloA/Tae2 family protein